MVFNTLFLHILKRQMAARTLSFFVTFLLCAVCLSTTVSAGPVRSIQPKHVTHHTRKLSRSLTLQSYHPISSFQVRNVVSGKSAQLLVLN